MASDPVVLLDPPPKVMSLGLSLHQTQVISEHQNRHLDTGTKPSVPSQPRPRVATICAYKAGKASLYFQLTH